MDLKTQHLANSFIRSTVIFLALVIVTIVGFLIFIFVFLDDSKPPDNTTFFLDSSPQSEEVFSTNPINVVINASRDLTSNSKIIIQKDRQEFGLGEVVVDSNKTTIRKELKPEMGDGKYLVKYNNCFENGKCGYGQFTFTIDSSKKADHKDLRNQKEVFINMVELRFYPSKIIISPGTKVNWLNTDPVEHFVNTDPHPSHTYYLDQNSLDIPANGNYSVTLTRAGEYPYHCSAHYPEGMTGRIIVQ